MSTNDIPRRAFVNKMIPAELSIRESVQSVERLAAHPLLTDAVVMLGDAQRKVADWYDQHATGEQQEHARTTTEIQQPAPVSATEPDAVRMLREGMRGQHALFNVNQEYVCAVAPLLEYIDALTARLAATERERDDVIACARGTSMDDAAIHSMRKYIAEKINIEDERNDLAVRLAEAERVTEEQVERAAIALYASTGANASSFRTEHHYAQKTYYDKARRALTAARGGG